MLRLMRRLPLAAALACAATAATVATADPLPIIGGTSTTVGQYPTVVAITVGGGLCTGTLIDPEWVLTAAHCLTPSVLQLPSQQAVTQGVRVHFNTINLAVSGGEVRTASVTSPKPGFSLANLGQNDIGLIRLAKPMTAMAPTPVNFDPARAPVGTVVSMVGYGATQVNGGGTVGVEFALDNRASTGCASFDLSDANVLCFSQADSKGKCRGDSGGPSFAQLDGTATLVGVTSFGDDQCAQLSADTRTDAERQFIQSTIAGCAGDQDCGDKICYDRRCIAPPFSPTGLGATCSTGADCESGTCGQGPDGKRCTELCMLGPDACPDGFDCLAASGASGACWPHDHGGGCCDARGRAAPPVLLGIAAAALLRRRRRHL